MDSSAQDQLSTRWGGPTVTNKRLMIRSQALKLPVGDVPDWEVNGSDSEHSDFKSPAESLVILQSLKQSRDKWLRAMFPKFSSRGRGGKQPDVVPPPHTIYNRGRCTLQIGPHFFMDTTVFEVHYRPFPVVSQPTPFVYQSAPGNSSSQTVHQPQALPSPSAKESGALLSSLSSALPVPPGLISHVNSAATSNPILANLLHLAASGRATPDQLKTLGLLIQSLASSPVTGVPAAAASQPGLPGTDPLGIPLPIAPAASQSYQCQTTIKDFDIVIEFREVPSDRWVFPRGPAMCDSVSASEDPGSVCDLTISTIVPFPCMTSPQDVSGSEISSPAEPPSKQVVEFHFKAASSYIHDTFSRWVGSKEKMEENRKFLIEIEPPQQKFLAYRLAEGSQLSQIQNAALPPHAMKSIKPSAEGGRPKRRSAPRKSAQDPLSSPTTKRKRQAQPKSQVPPSKIACFACGQANVPLIMGGRYCRPCVEGGRIGETPPVSGVTISNKLSTHESAQPHPESATPQSPTSQPDKVS